MRKALFSAISKVPVLMSLAFDSSPSHAAAQIAASIEYEIVTRPSGLPDDFQPASGTSLKFLAIKAIDGFRVDAALWQPSGEQPADTALIVMVHGSGDNYTLAANSTLSRS